MNYDLQTYKNIFFCFNTYRTGLKVGDVIQPQILMARLRLMPDVAHEILDAMEKDGLLTQESLNTNSTLGSIGNVWRLTKIGYEFYIKNCL